VTKSEARIRSPRSATPITNKLRYILLLLPFWLVLSTHANAETTGPKCRSATAKSAILLRVSGFKIRSGIINIWIYDGNPADFLVRDKRILRLKFPVPAAGPMLACIPVPAPGRYAIAAHHDVDSNRKRDWNDGLGFSGNPRLSLLRLKPSYAQTSFAVGENTTLADLTLLYRYGLSIRSSASRSR